MLSYTTLSDAELERWIYSSPHDVRALDEALNRLTTGEEKYTAEDIEDAEQTAREEAYDEGFEDGKADETLA